ncbi:20635_t:CDS:2, partial [Dentiscutata erythropus]
CELNHLENIPTQRLDLEGPIIFWPGDLYNTTEQWFAYINCSTNSTSNDMITAQGNGSAAIILYNDTDICTYPTSLTNINIPVFSEKFTRCYSALSSSIQEIDQPPTAIIRGGGRNGTHYDGYGGPYSSKGSTVSDNSNTSTNDNSAQPYQTAMVVLYTISGVVLGLFFLVVITNVVINRVRSQQDSGIISNNDSGQGQKHVGIAKAVLESFPVYLFSLRNNSDVNKDLENGKDIKDIESKEMQTDDKNDIPLKELSQETNQKDETPQLSEVEGDESLKNDNQNLSNSDNNQSTPENSVPVIPPPISNKVTEEQLTCPICLGDFESGEELRILPCHHQYHTEEASTSLNEGSSSLASTSQNETDTTSSHSSHVFPHFRWVKYLTSARRARSERRRNRRPRNGHSGNTNQNES